MIQYQVRSVQLLNLINDLISEKLVSDPFYQRNLVWRVNRTGFVGDFFI